MKEEGKLVNKILIRSSIQKVWHEITRTDKPVACFFGSLLETTGLKPGAPIRMRTPNGKYTGVVGDVIEFDPPRLFSHTFSFTSNEDPPCKVTYQLEEVNDGVEFTLTVEEIPEGTETEKYMVQGSDFIVNTLKHVVERGKPHLKGQFILFMCRVTEFMSTEQMKSENWPLPGEERVETEAISG